MLKKHAAARKRGRNGEDAAATFLKEAGAEILVQNWHSGHLEIDIICRHNGILIFTEVKTRDKNSMIRPDEALTAAKKEKLIRAATIYLTENNAWGIPCRFDLICVRCNGKNCEVEHYPHAFDQTDIMGSGNATWQPW